MAEGNAERQQFRLQPLTAAALAFSLAGHAVGIWSAFAAYDPAFFPFFPELIACLVFSAAGSAASVFAPYREQFRFLHALKLLASVMAVRLNSGDQLIAGWVPIATLFIELALFEELRWGIACAAAEAALVSVFGLGERPAPVHAFSVFLGALSFSATALLTRYRDRIIETETALRNYSNAFKKLAESNLDLQSFAVSSGTASAELERKKISGALHDSIGYALTNIVAASSAIDLLAESDPAQARQLARSMCELSTNCLREVRQTLRVLRVLKEEPPVLIVAIHKAISVFQATTGVNVDFNYGNLPWEFKNRAISQTLYRLVQEGMTNAFRHGKADLIRITMWMTDTDLNARIWDNGRGCASLEEGLGITDLRERIQDLGGGIRVESQTGGFSLLVFFPYSDQGEHAENTSADSR